MASNSAVEVLNQLIIAQELIDLNNTDYTKIRKKTESITNKLNALRNHQINN